MLSLLATSLRALLLGSPALTAPTTPNDPFQDLTVHAPEQPEPVYCLRPLSPLEPPADEDIRILLSFEKHVSESDTIAHPGLVVRGRASGPFEERLEPHFRIPITDRFNYASLDCSARVHAAHKSAHSAMSILSSKKDRFMLSPCSEKDQYVIVELCEDIRIDTGQPANFEFFSGSTRPDRNSGRLRGRSGGSTCGSFHPPPTLRDFYRLIRIDFHSHYGSEYYSPVSLLRVYVLTHLDAWQWETWEAESRAKRFAGEASPPVAVVADAPTPAHTPVIHSDDAEVVSQTLVESDSSSSDTPVTSDILDSLQHNIYSSSDILDIPKSPEAATVHGRRARLPPSLSATTPRTTPHDLKPTIYRLTALKASNTLYARYVEEQTAGMCEVLWRLAEDTGRMEGIKQIRRLEDEQRDLLHRVNYLTDKVVLEKRLGIAQLCLLLTVLVFMALTRGSRGEYAHPPGPRTSGSMREWGRRTLSFSGELVGRLRIRNASACCRQEP
ncbi:hypothetical protein C8T65DRAFT_694654 [Cerioporus squamosus]|nr:hypothetical protein C8T65DRAFT_694654 [Cerioporus squamosus]